jgi:hypothetical protein
MSPKKRKAKQKKPKKKARAVKKVKKAGAAKKPGRKKARTAKRKTAKKKTAARRKPLRKKAAKKKAPARARKKKAKKAPRKTARAKTPKKGAARTAGAPGAAKPAPAPPDERKPGRKRRSRRGSRRATLIRRGPDGEILAPGDLLLPGGAKGAEEIQYLFRGCTSAERPVDEEAVSEVLAKRGIPEGPGEREELRRAMAWARERFGGGDVEPIVPVRSNLRRTFEGVVDRARQRRREIGAFLRGLDMGHTETSHMDAHGEASLQSLMEWAARLENLVENLEETPESNQGHYAQFHRVLDQLESTTEALIIDVEQTLRRLRDRLGR